MGNHLRVLSESYLMNTIENSTSLGDYQENYLHPWALDESGLSIEKGKPL